VVPYLSFLCEPLWQKKEKNGVVWDKFGVFLAKFGVIWAQFGVVLDNFGNSFTPKNRIYRTKNQENTKKTDFKRLLPHFIAAG